MGKYIRKYDGYSHIVDKARNQQWYGESVCVREVNPNEYEVFYVSPDYPEAGWHFDETTKYSVEAQFNSGGILVVTVSFDAIDDYLIDNNFYVAIEIIGGYNNPNERGNLYPHFAEIEQSVDIYVIKPHRRIYNYETNAKRLFDGGTSGELPDDWRFTFGVRVCFIQCHFDGQPIRNNKLIMKNFIYDYEIFTYLYKDVK